MYNLDSDSDLRQELEEILKQEEKERKGKKYVR